VLLSMLIVTGACASVRVLHQIGVISFSVCDNVLNIILPVTL